MEKYLEDNRKNLSLQRQNVCFDYVAECRKKQQNKAGLFRDKGSLLRNKG